MHRFFPMELSILEKCAWYKWSSGSPDTFSTCSLFFSVWKTLRRVERVVEKKLYNAWYFPIWTVDYTVLSGWNVEHVILSPKIKQLQNYVRSRCMHLAKWVGACIGGFQMPIMSPTSRGTHTIKRQLYSEPFTLWKAASFIVQYILMVRTQHST